MIQAGDEAEARKLKWEMKNRRVARACVHVCVASLHMLQSRILGCSGLRSEGRKPHEALSVRKRESSGDSDMAYLPTSTPWGQGQDLGACLHAIL